MCDRFSQPLAWPELARAFKLTNAKRPQGFRKSYNISPSQLALVIRDTGQGLVAEMLQWGIVPAWATKKPVAKPYNARTEDLAQSKQWATMFRTQRCLVPALGFFVWPRRGQPQWVGMADKTPMVMAGVWDRWTNRLTGVPEETFAIVTTKANAAISRFQDRMPVILSRPDWYPWLGPDGVSLPLKHVVSAERLSVHSVSPKAKSVKVDGADLIGPGA